MADATPYRLIRDTVIRRAREISTGIPVDVVGIAHSLGVAEVASRAIPFDGYLGRRSDGQLAIRYREGVPRVRTRFTIAHEIGHILIADALGTRVSLPVNRADARDNEEERLADRLAAEILLPCKHVESMLRRWCVSWRTLMRIAHACEASVSSVLVRVGELEGVGFLKICVETDRQFHAIGRAQVISRRLGRLLFHRPPQLEGRRLVEGLAAGKSTLHLTATLNGREQELLMLGRGVIRTERVVADFITWSA